MKKFSIPHDLLDALHFFNGARVNFAGTGQKLQILEPRNGKKNKIKNLKMLYRQSPRPMPIG